MKPLFVFLIALGSTFLNNTLSHASEDVKCVQTFLNFKGYVAGTVDGKMGRKTIAAASKSKADLNLDLEPLSEANAASWCAYAKTQDDFVAYQSFDHPTNGLVSKDVLMLALQRKPQQVRKACKAYDFLVDELEATEPVKKISGFNSRMDNAVFVKRAREAERFAGVFSQASINAFLLKDEEQLTRLVKVLATWAEQKAFLGTIKCVTASGGLITRGKCTEWKRRDGKDPSGMKDATFSTFLMAGIIRSYQLFLSAHDTDGLKQEHKAINQWIKSGFAKRLKSPSKVYFGLNMGWYWPSINLDYARGNISQARKKLQTLQRSMDKLMLSDGSIRDRTTRGDRALWYHYTSLGEVIMSLEMVRAAGLSVQPSLEKKLHKAVDLFIRTTQDYSVIHPWAKKRRNSSYKNKTQDWNKYTWQNSNFAGSWLHIYPYRYPDHPNSKQLTSLVGWQAKSAYQDNDYGIGIGCLYNLAADRIPLD